MCTHKQHSPHPAHPNLKTSSKVVPALREVRGFFIPANPGYVDGKMEAESQPAAAFAVMSRTSWVYEGTQIEPTKGMM